MEANEKILKQAYEIGELKKENTQLIKEINELEEDTERKEERIRNLIDDVNRLELKYDYALEQYVELKNLHSRVCKFFIGNIITPKNENKNTP